MDIVWKKSGYEVPKVLKAINKKSGEKFLVVEDGIIIKLMNKNGQFYLVTSPRCKLIGDYYSCDEPIHPISCSKTTNDREKFALENLRTFL